MGKIFNTSEDIVDLIETKFQETNLFNYGITLKIMSVTKAKDIIKVSKASATTEFIAKKDGLVQIFIYEAAFDRLSDDAKNILVEMALTNIMYDVERDKLSVESNPFNQIFCMRKKYGDRILDDLELSYIIIKQIEEEEKEKKMMEKETKKNKNR